MKYYPESEKLKPEQIDRSVEYPEAPALSKIVPVERFINNQIKAQNKNNKGKFGRRVYKEPIDLGKWKCKKPDRKPIDLDKITERLKL